MPRASSSASTSANGCWRPLALMITARGCTTSSTSALVELSEPWCPAFSTSARSSPGAVAIHQPSSCCSASPGKSILKSPRDAEQQRSEEHTSELQSLAYLVCRLLLEKK